MNDPPIGISTQDLAIVINQTRGNDDGFGCFAQLGSRRLSGQVSFEELCARIGLQNNLFCPVVTPMCVIQVVSCNVQLDFLVLERFVCAPNFDDGVNGEQRGRTIIRVCLVFFTCNTDGI